MSSLRKITVVLMGGVKRMNYEFIMSQYIYYISITVKQMYSVHKDTSS